MSAGGWTLRRLHVVDDGHLFMLTRAPEIAPVVRGFLGAEPA